MKVLIISGGNSQERKISLISASNVKAALETLGYKALVYDLRKGKEKLKEKIKSYDVAFPVIHGEEGEGGELHQYLKKLGKPYVGGDYKGYKKGWDKISFKKFCENNGIPTAKWKEIKTKEDVLRFGFPCVLKSSNGGSSREVFLLKSEKELKLFDVQKLLQSGNPLFVEKYLKGIEVTVGILNDKALPVIEIVPPENEWFDYKNKYSGKTREIPFAPSVESKIQDKLQELALRIHKTLNLGPYSRTDFIVIDGIPYALEVNTIPGMTAQSLLPKAAKAIGISYEQLVDQLVQSAFKQNP